MVDSVGRYFDGPARKWLSAIGLVLLVGWSGQWLLHGSQPLASHVLGTGGTLSAVILVSWWSIKTTRRE